MSKVTKPISSVLKGAGDVVSSVTGGLGLTPPDLPEMPEPPPPPPEPEPMPIPDTESALATAANRQRAARSRTSGRASTLLAQAVGSPSGSLGV